MVIIISGTPAAGKSSVAKALAEKFLKSAYIPVDDLWGMVIGSYVVPWDPKGPEQFKLVEKNFLSMTRNFLDEGFVVILDYVFNDEQVKHYDELFGEVFGFLLLPSKEELKKRDLARDPEGGMHERIEALYPDFANVPHPVLKVIDSTDQTLEETVNQIFDLVQK
jgi:adenylate kinase family enzyme